MSVKSDRSVDQLCSLDAQSRNRNSKQLQVAFDSLNNRGAKIDFADRYQNLKWNTDEFGLPNFIFKSSLFKALQRNRREPFSQREITSLDRIRFSVSGPTLNQSDLDVLIGLVRLARLQKFASSIEFRERIFLLLIDRGGQYGKVGKSDRDWLSNSISRLCSTKITFTSGPNLYEGSLVLEYLPDGLNGCYRVSLNPRFLDSYGIDNWTKLNINIRNSLRGNPLAQFLYGFFHSNARTFPLKVQTIHDFSGSDAGKNIATDFVRNKALIGWRDDTLRPALAILQAKLKEHGLVFEWKIDSTNLLIVKHQPSNSQQRHLYLKGYPQKPDN